jgi:DNA-binding Lrp family transcriptional regulator
MNQRRLQGAAEGDISMQNLQIELLQLLQQDCRMPLEKLAVMLGQPLEAVAGMIDDLEKRGIILRYSPVINWDKTDKERVEAMIEVRVTPQRDEGFDAIAKRIYRFDEVKTVYLMSGAYDLLLLVEAHSLKELAFFVSTKLSVLDNVTGTATHFVLKRYKSDGVIFEGDTKDKRLAVNP